jgi:hypothetical protein
MPNVGLIEVDSEQEQDVTAELYSVLTRYLKPSTISNVLNDIQGDVIGEVPKFCGSISLTRVIELLQEYHTQVLAHQAEADQRD